MEQQKLEKFNDIKSDTMKLESSSRSWAVQLNLETSREVGKFNENWKDDTENNFMRLE